MTTFSTALRYYRTRAGLSQSMLGVQAGYDHSYICRLEAGTRTPSRETVVVLAGALDLSPLDADKLRLAAGFAPCDLVGLVEAACEHLTANTTHRIVFDHAGTVRGMLGALIAALEEDERDFNIICREVSP